MQEQKSKKTFIAVIVGVWIVTVIGLGMLAYTPEQEQTQSSNETASSETGEENSNEGELEFNPPSLDDLDPEDPMTEYILYGDELFSESNTVMSEHVGNELSCASCHANGGMAQSNSMVGVVPNFPEFNKRAGTVFTIEDRINGCMIRSMNGEKLEEDSREMRSMVAFLTYISEGIEIGEEVPWRVPSNMPEIPEPDFVNGEELYEQLNCMTCHATDGSGTGANTGPALWGDNSFNDGAGMARLSKAAGYIQDNMPPGGEGTLSDQEAADLAAYMLAQYRPEFDGHANDWPNGRPTDIFDRERVESIKNGTFEWSEIDNVIPRVE
ncbi:c-type cytochrome [Oceanobacillus sp. CAU 1775]